MARVTDVLEVWAQVGVIRAEVGDHQRIALQVRLDDAKDRQVQVITAVEEEQINWSLQIGECLPGVTDSQLDKLRETRVREGCDGRSRPCSDATRW